LAGGHFTVVSFDSNGVVVGRYFDLVFDGTGAWEPAAGIYSVPSEAVRVDVHLQSERAGLFWFDDVRFEPTDEVISNGDFELGSAGWTLPKQVSVNSNSANVHSGTSCLVLHADGPWEGARQSPQVVEGTSYTLRGWGRSTIDGGRLSIVSFGSDGKVVGAIFDMPFAGTGHWVSFTGTYKAPPDAVRIDLFLQSSTAGVFWFDDVSMVRKQ
jgi:hypothetical protein